jgi:pyruvate formate lyase activating enzyme
MLSALILHLQRLSTEDGPGLRTTVFFKGCSLRCAWCHNPESLSPRPQVQWIENRCIGCDTCLGACPNGCLTRTPQGVTIDRARCQGCGACAEACPANALELLGTRVGVDDLLAQVVKDRVYYEQSGGGVTVSGGEPALQAEFVAEFLRRLKDTGIHTALDTCGACSASSLAPLLPHTDLVLFDLKEIDPEKHRQFTGQPNQRILENLLIARDALARQPGKTLWLRTPLIPGATATRENLTGLGAFIAENLDGRVERWELCAFNNLCRDKYRRLGIEWRYADTPLMTLDELRQWEACARQSGVRPDIVTATGAT